MYNGTEFQSGIMKKVWRQWGLLPNHVNVLKAIEVRKGIFCVAFLIFFLPQLKKKKKGLLCPGFDANSVPSPPLLAPRSPTSSLRDCWPLPPTPCFSSLPRSLLYSAPCRQCPPLPLPLAHPSLF